MEIFVKTLLFSRKCDNMMIAFVGEKGAKNYIMHESTKDIEMTNEEYREELRKLFDDIDDNRILRYFYIFVSKKIAKSM